MSTAATSLPTSLFIVALSMTESVDTVGDVASCGLIFYRYFLPSTTPRPFIDLPRFYFRNMSSAIESCFRFSKISSILTGWNASLMCNFSISNVTPFSTFCLSFFIPHFIYSCVSA